MVRVLWSKVLEPLRAALMASIICQKVASSVTDLSKDELLVCTHGIDSSERVASPLLSSPGKAPTHPLRQVQASKYESWAIGLLRHDHRLDDDSFAKLLMQLPRAVRPPTLADGSTRKSFRKSKGSASAADSEAASASSAPPQIYLDRWPESPLVTCPADRSGSPGSPDHTRPLPPPRRPLLSGERHRQGHRLRMQGVHRDATGARGPQFCLQRLRVPSFGACGAG